MQRLSGWEQRLAATTAAAMRTPFEWGVNDCALFACDCILAMTGEDLGAEFRGSYDNEREAYKVLARLGYADLGALAKSRLDEIEPRDACRGDVVLIPAEAGGSFLAICDGRTAVGPIRETRGGRAPRGIAHSPMSAATRAWRVG